MKKIFTLLTFTFLILSSYAATYVITNVGITFSPSTITINITDTINFVIATNHNAVEVSQATWNINGSTSNGGFSVPSGGGKVSFTQPGTYYYVCQPHAEFGMKGTITVTGAASVETAKSQNKISVYPNASENLIRVNLMLKQPSVVKYSIYNLTGEKVFERTSKLQMGEITDEVMLQKSLKKGIYIMEININNRKYIKKIIF